MAGLAERVLGAGFLATDALVRRDCACGTGQAAGAAVLSRVPLPAAAAPVLTSLVAGVLLRAALAAWQLRPARQHPASKPAASHS